MCTSALAGGIRRLPFRVTMGHLVCASGLAVALHLGGVSLLAVFALSGWIAFTFPRAGVLALPVVLLSGLQANLSALADESVLLRLDHGVMAGLVLAVLLRDGVHGTGAFPFRAWLLFLGWTVLATTTGLILRRHASPAGALFYTLQLTELIAVGVVAAVYAPRKASTILYAFLLPALYLAATGMAEHLWPLPTPPGEPYRTFERGYFHGEANHYAGIFAMAIAIAMVMLHTRRWWTLGALALPVCAVALLTTESRTGIAAAAAGVGVVVFLRWPRVRLPLIAAALSGLVLFGPEIWHRLTAPGGSFHDRLIAWKSGLSTLGHVPLFGIGFGARHRSFYDSQYILLVAETGVVGLALFIAALANTTRAFVRCAGGLVPTLMGVGIAAVFAVHGLAASSLIITVVSGAFFWWCGVLLGRVRDEVV